MEYVRRFDTTVKQKTQVFFAHGELERGMPCGLSGNKAIPITAKHRGFLGFVEGHVEDGQVLVITRGACLLKITDIHFAKTGAPIFCNGENAFNLSEGHRIGVVKHFQPDLPGFATVCFHRFDDAEPFITR